MLAPRGVERLIFGITTARPGQSPTRAAVEQALGDALDVAGRARTRALTLPEVGTRIPGIELAEAGTLLATELAGHLRRSSGLDEVVIAGLHRAYLRACRDALISRGAWVGS
jgi:O-acetyl-ADP-ribose deacetylase (regulator of RNase III)